MRVVYLLTYPFFIEGDGFNYYQLLETSHSNLLHATGYVFLSLIPFWIGESFADDPGNLLRYWQQLLSASGPIALYLALQRIAPRWIALLVSGAVGLDFQMTAAAGTTRPEFFQATILMLLISSAIFGFTAGTKERKTFFYAAAGVLGMAGYLTKYNSIAAFAFCAIPLLDRGFVWKARIRALVVSATAALALLVIFLVTFHYPTTSSFHLNLEHGWIHML